MSLRAKSVVLGWIAYAFPKSNEQKHKHEKKDTKLVVQSSSASASRDLLHESVRKMIDHRPLLRIRECKIAMEMK